MKRKGIATVEICTANSFGAGLVQKEDGRDFLPFSRLDSFQDFPADSAVG